MGAFCGANARSDGTVTGRPVVRRVVVEELEEELVGRKDAALCAKGREARGHTNQTTGAHCPTAVRERRVLSLRDEPSGDEKGDGEELDGEGVELP